MIGKEISHYKILNKLGEGGMGVVYKVQDTKLDRLLALKFLPPQLTVNDTDKARFLQEAKAASAINHPNVCVIHDIQEHENQQFIVMEYVEGTSLREIVGTTAKISPNINDVIDYALQIAAALEAAHDKGIIHRDIKSDNIMISTAGQIKVMDFGLAKLRGSAPLTKSSSTIGTLAYSSPEQISGREIDTRSDIFSFGVVLYELITGNLPFQGEYESAIVYSIVNDQPESPNKIRTDIPDILNTIIMKAIEKQPAERYQSMAEFIDNLNDLQMQTEKNQIGIRTQTDRFEWLKRPKIFVPAILVFVLIAFIANKEVIRQSENSKVENELIPQLKSAIEASDPWYTTKAFQLAKKIQRIQSDHPELLALWPEISSNVTLETDPPGAQVYIKEDRDPNSVWQDLGLSPIRDLTLPKTFFRWKVEKDGFESKQAIFYSVPRAGEGSETIKIKMDRSGEIPPGMVRIPGFEGIGEFYIDFCEVTNESYKQFVDGDGYREQKYWKFPIKNKGILLEWQEAIKLFVDQTGRPGPASWYTGDFEEGQAEYPVSGVSWYEAAAYAEFAGKSLPTDEHWFLASGQNDPNFFYFYNGYLVSSSNFSESGLEPVGKRNVINTYGLSDMAGNVREWCFNKSEKGRILNGGAWNDAIYLFNSSTQASPLDRSLKNGFRCVIYPDQINIDAKLFDPVAVISPSEYKKRLPVKDDVFSVYRELYSYDPTDLNSRIEIRDDQNSSWSMEKVSIKAAYGDARLNIYMFLPKNSKPPFQTILYSPGAGVQYIPSSEQIPSLKEFKKHVEFLLKSGRSVVFPVHYGTFENKSDTWDQVSASTHPHQFVQDRIKIIKDMKRAIDYICTRKDLDPDRIGYFGYSWGAALSPFTIATDTRIKAAVLKVGGYYVYSKAREEAQQYHYTPRVKIPVLMLNGYYDAFFSTEFSVKPMFEDLGTDADKKKLIIYPEADHWIPQNDLVRETLDWYDLYLGLVEN